MDYIDLIINETKKILINKGIPIPEISNNSGFFDELKMDSLDLATLIVLLEEITQLDPFREGFKSFHTIGELASLYEQACNH